MEDWKQNENSNSLKMSYVFSKPLLRKQYLHNEALNKSKMMISKSQLLQKCCTLYARPWAGFTMGVPSTECSIHHSYSYWQTTGKTQLKPLSTLTDQWPNSAKQEGKCCHSVRVLKNTIQGWHCFRRYAAVKESSSFHIKSQSSWGPVGRFYLLSDV